MHGTYFYIQISEYISKPYGKLNDMCQPTRTFRLEVSFFRNSTGPFPKKRGEPGTIAINMGLSYEHKTEVFTKQRFCKQKKKAINMGQQMLAELSSQT